MPSPVSVADRVIRWQAQSGRQDLPWQTPATPYRVWVSEIMLQQTQVATVVPYFERFMAALPDPAALAAASRDDVLKLWTGLGYYARGRNLHRAAQRIVAEHGGELPADLEQLIALPGIGRSTAGAILSLAFGVPAPILDGNVKRVLARYHAVPGWPGKTDVAQRLWALAESHVPNEEAGRYTQGMMDLGATICTRTKPACTVCPLVAECRGAAAGQPEDYPGRRPKRQRRQRSVRVVMVEDDGGAVLLERRPDAGVWGGLWSLPELADDGAAAEWCRRELAAAPISEAELAPIDHAFTHFDLRMRPIHLRIRAANSVADDRDRLWYRPEAQADFGMPAPIVKLITRSNREGMP